jgi:hypothetical protein
LWLLAAVEPLAAEEPRKTQGLEFQVPYRLTETFHFLVRVKINGKGPFNFILDTGAPALFITTDVAKQVGIEPDSRGWGVADRFEIEGGLVISGARARIETPFQLEGMNGLGLAGAKLHGMIGYTILARYRINFDLTKEKLTWMPLDFRPPPPLGLGERSAPGGLDALGSVMKLLGTFLGAKTEREIGFRGMLGLELLDTSDGIEIKAVFAGGPADRAGLKQGDRIARFRDQDVTTIQELLRAAAKVGAGREATLTVVRGRDRRDVKVQLGEGL